MPRGAQFMGSEKLLKQRGTHSFLSLKMAFGEFIHYLCNKCRQCVEYDGSRSTHFQLCTHSSK
jgi:hypothetical protein